MTTQLSMKHKTPVIVALALALSVTVPAVAGASARPSDAIDAMTLYSQGMAVVADSRKMDLKSGAQTITWPMAVAPAPDSLSLEGPGVRLVGFDIDGSAASAMGDLSSRVGQSVTVTDADGNHARQGTLIGVSADTIFVQIDDRIERIPASAPVLIGWPASSSDRSTPAGQVPVVLHVIADNAGTHALHLLYQRDAPSWQASYTGRFDAGSGKLTLQANAIIDNSGNAPLNADKAWLVAGQINRTGGSRSGPVVFMAQAKAAGAGAPDAVGGLYRYPLPDGLHVPAGATRAMSLMTSPTLDADRETRFSNQAGHDTGDQRAHAVLVIHARNTSGEPLPAGPVQVYAAADAAQLLGADQLDDTPTGAPIELTLGQAFDITGTHDVGTMRGSPARQVTITLYNATDQSRQVTIIERLPPNAHLAQGAPEPSGGDASTPHWQVRVPANGQQTFRYRFTPAPSSDHG